MGKKAAIAVACGLVMATNPTQAEGINALTECHSAVMALDSGEKERLSPIILWIANQLRKLDELAANNGHTKIFPKMSPDGLSNSLLMVFEYCRDHSKDNLGAAAKNTYDGLFALQKDFGNAN